MKFCVEFTTFVWNKQPCCCSDNPAFCLDCKLPTTSNNELATLLIEYRIQKWSLMIKLELSAFFPASIVLMLLFTDSFLTTKFFVCYFKMSGRLATGERGHYHSIYNRNVNWSGFLVWCGAKVLSQCLSGAVVRVYCMLWLLYRRNPGLLLFLFPVYGYLNFSTPTCVPYKQTKTLRDFALWLS